MRRPADAQQTAATALTCADLILDVMARIAQRGARGIALQPREYQILAYLMRRQDRVVTRTMLLEGVWDYHFDPATNVIDVHVSRLRKKIDGPPGRGRQRREAQHDRRATTLRAG